jgi:CubicO group peptidase (beta-lactamase class C family)
MRVKKILIVTVAVVAAFISGHTAAAEQAKTSAADMRAAIDAIAEQRIKDGGMVGVGGAIIVNKKVVWMKGYGFADKERGIAFTPDTVMNIGSISKTFTGVALMRAVQDGKVSLDENINSYRRSRSSIPIIRANQLR